MSAHTWTEGLKSIRQLAPALRSWFTALLLIAFALQGQLTQTHLHLSGGDQASFGGEATPFSAKAPGGLPVEDSASQCALCQVAALSGSFTPSAPPVLFLPVAEFAPAFAPAFTPALSLPRVHHWRGRAPPTL